MHSGQEGPVRILIVDDEADMREGLRDVLEESGYNVRLACNGHEALAYLAEDDFVHVITLDMKMPGLSGIEVLQAIKEMGRDIAVIIMTGYGSLEVAVDAMKRGAHDYLIKPIDMEEMKVAIEKAIEKQRLTFENKRLVQDLEKINEQLKMKVNDLLNLNEASRLLCSVLDLDTLLESCLSIVTSISRSERVSIMLVDESGEMVIRKARGIREDIVHSVRVRPGEGISGIVAREGKPLRNVDLELDGREDPDLSRNYTSKAFLSVPVYRKDKVIGVLNVTNRQVDEPFSDDEMDIISILANQAAVAIENAELYTNLEKTLNQIKATQEQLIRSEKLASLGQLAAGIAHEINNPLAIISGCAQLLSILAAKKEKLTELDFKEISRDLDTIIRETEHCGRLTDNLLQFSRKAPQEAKPTDINELLKQILSLVENQANLRNIKVMKRLGHGLPAVMVDHGQIRQVFLNMLLNAAQAMPDGGTLCITTRQTSSIEVIFQDTGVGIPEESLKDIFDPFFTTKKEGVGLGLFISQTIIERHKGSINVESRAGEGTTFTISLPVN